MTNPNPNPRGWRQGVVFVDLARVRAAYYYPASDDDAASQGLGGFARLVLGGGGTRVGEVAIDVTSIPMTRDAFHALLNDLEIYRSGR